MKQQSQLAPLILSFLSFFLIGIGAASIFLFQTPLQENDFETRNAAAIDTGMVLLTTSPQSGSSFQSNQSATIYIQANTQNVQVDGVQLTFKVTTTAGQLVVNPVVNSGIQVTNVEVEKVSDGYLVSFMALPLGNASSFSSTTATNIVQLVLSNLSAETTKITFDNTNSKSIVHDSNPLRDELKTLPVFSYTVIAAASPTPNPSAKQCNGSCTTNSECQSNFLCYQNQCRLATNPTSSTCASPPDNGLQRTCNQYCADTKECKSGYTCFANRCRTPENPDSTTCGQVTASTTQAMNKSCNLSCASNKECAVNLRCYNGACRLATNPSSTTCAAATASTVSTYYGKGQKGADDGSDSLTATLSGKNIASPEPEVGPYTPPATSNIDIARPLDFFKTLLQNIESRGISFPAIAVAAGIVLLILALLVTLFSRRRGAPPARLTTIASNVPPAPAKPPQQVQQPSARSTDSSEYEQSLRTKINELKTQNKTETQPVVENAPTSPPPSSSSMMERLKQKQVLEKMPNPTTSENTP